MFDSFEKKFTQDFKAQCVRLKKYCNPNDSFEFFLNKFEGVSFNNGSYRIFRIENLKEWNNTIFEIFPQFANLINCFAYDWLGKIFAVNKIDPNQILIFDIGIGKVLEVPVGFEEFHNKELVEYTEDALSTNFYKEWLNKSENRIPQIDECIGYRVPLFLGGIDDVANLEIINMDVYWNITGQVLRKVLNLPDGTLINKIDIE